MECHCRSGQTDHNVTKDQVLINNNCRGGPVNNVGQTFHTQDLWCPFATNTINSACLSLRYGVVTFAKTNALVHFNCSFDN